MKKWVGLLLLLATGALAESYWWNATPQENYGVFYLDAGVATVMPRTHGGANLSLTNLDVATIYCGGDSSVTNTNFGLPIASGAQANISLSFNSKTANPLDGGTTAGAVFCYSVLGVAPDGGSSGIAWWELQ